MYNTDTELLFPIRVIPTLSALRGEIWRQLVNDVTSSKATTADQLAFVLLMVKMGGCVTCNADSFRAMRGCTQCAWQTIKRFRGSDEELMEQYQQYKKEVDTYLGTRLDKNTILDNS